MLDNDIFISALLFPAIPLMMITFTNRYSSVASLIRKIHDEIINKGKENVNKNYIAELKILKKRIFFIKTVQITSALAFICNCITILSFSYSEIYLANFFFTFSVLLMILALFLFILEITFSSRALNKHLDDIREL